jgi:stage II sporulation protein D
MGRAGKSYREILAFYYPGASVGLNAQGMQWQRLSGESITLLTARPDTDRPTLTAAERLLRGLAVRTGWPVPPGIELRVYPDVETFRNATGEAGWVAAYTSGTRIHLQPTTVLRSRGALDSTLSHELLHLLMEAHAATALPLWFREGLADYLEGAKVTAAPPDKPSDKPSEQDMRQTTDPARARRAYAQAHAEVAQLVHTYGETAVLGWVVRGLPPEVMKASTSHAPPNNK